MVEKGRGERGEDIVGEVGGGELFDVVGEEDVVGDAAEGGGEVDGDFGA